MESAEFDHGVSPGSLRACSDSQTSSFRFVDCDGEKVVTLKDNRMAGSGGHLWSSAIFLARWIALNQRRFVGKVVVELGCGLALPSFVAAHYAKEVNASDLTPSVLSLLAENIELNANTHKGVRVKIMPLDFGSEHSLPNKTADIIIFSDVVYNEEVAVALPRMLKWMLRQGACAIGILPSTTRVGLQTFFTRLSKLGISCDVQELDDSVLDGLDNQELQCKLLVLKSINEPSISDCEIVEELLPADFGPLLQGVE